jgi:ABC-type multidrug transport system permease subunit
MTWDLIPSTKIFICYNAYIDLDYRFHFLIDDLGKRLLNRFHLSYTIYIFPFLVASSIIFSGIFN